MNQMSNSTGAIPPPINPAVIRQLINIATTEDNQNVVNWLVKVLYEQEHKEWIERTFQKYEESEVEDDDYEILQSLKEHYDKVGEELNSDDELDFSDDEGVEDEDSLTVVHFVQAPDDNIEDE